MDIKYNPGWYIEIGSFSRSQTEILKGVGILLIVLHNIFHNMTPIIGQNEFNFSQATFVKFYQTIADNPLELLRAAFSYFGHYGVQIFIFFSAYGLTRKYYSRHLAAGPFLKTRLEKIYLSFLICVMVYVALGLLKSSFAPDQQVLYWDSLAWKILLVSNFLPNQAMMPVGPWWFIPFIFQVYLFYPLLLALFKRYGPPFLVIISLASLLAKLYLNPILNAYGLNINFMIFGHLSVLSLGIYLAAQDRIRVRAEFVAVSLVLFVLGNFNAYVWVTEDLTLTVLVIAITVLMINKGTTRPWLIAFLTFYGGISFHLFMVNGFLRSPFHNFAESYNTWWTDNLAAFGSLIFSTLFAIGLMALDRKIRLVFFKIK